MLDQPAFLNACLRIETALGPEALLDACKAVEAALGRERGGVRHGPRPVDVDVLLLGIGAYTSERLAIPHRELARRRFVLVPLLELDPRWSCRAGRRWPRHSPRSRARPCAAPARRWTCGRERLRVAFRPVRSSWAVAVGMVLACAPAATAEAATYCVGVRTAACTARDTAAEAFTAARADTERDTILLGRLSESDRSRTPRAGPCA